MGLDARTPVPAIVRLNPWPWAPVPPVGSPTPTSPSRAVATAVDGVPSTIPEPHPGDLLLPLRPWTSAGSAAERLRPSGAGRAERPSTASNPASYRPPLGGEVMVSIPPCTAERPEPIQFRTPPVPIVRACEVPRYPGYPKNLPRRETKTSRFSVVSKSSPGYRFGAPRVGVRLAGLLAFRLLAVIGTGLEAVDRVLHPRRSP